MIIGRAVIDEAFRTALSKGPEKTLADLGLDYRDQTKAAKRSITPQQLIDEIIKALNDTEGTYQSIEDLLKLFRKLYLDSSDGVIRPRCG